MTAPWGLFDSCTADSCYVRNGDIHDFDEHGWFIQFKVFRHIGQYIIRDFIPIE